MLPCWSTAMLVGNVSPVFTHVCGGGVASVCTADWPDAGLDMEEKLSFFRETRHAFGRTALLLSGGGGLGSFHLVSPTHTRPALQPPQPTFGLGGALPTHTAAVEGYTAAGISVGCDHSSMWLAVASFSSP